MAVNPNLPNPGAMRPSPGAPDNMINAARNRLAGLPNVPLYGKTPVYEGIPSFGEGYGEGRAPKGPVAPPPLPPVMRNPLPVPSNPVPVLPFPLPQPIFPFPGLGPAPAPINDLTSLPAPIPGPGGITEMPIVQRGPVTVIDPAMAYQSAVARRLGANF